jgi:hypothetical protein
MLGDDPGIGISALRLWLAAGSSALLAAGLIAVSVWTNAAASVSPALRAAVLALAALLGASVMWALVGGADRSRTLQALQLRAQDLAMRTFAPGSALACLDTTTSDDVAAACESALFASPASVATATSYVAERFALLTDMVAFAARAGIAVDSIASPLRRSLEADRFGFLGHVLAQRHGCTDESCPALRVLHDSKRVSAHIREAVLVHYVDRYITAWTKGADTPVAALGTARTVAEAQAPTEAPHKVVNMDFPSAASIPAVSIMTPEPSGPVIPGVAAAAAANPNHNSGPSQAVSSSHRARRSVGGPPPPTVQASTGAAVPVEPIWPEPVPVVSHVGAPQPQAVAAPVQLSPYPTPVQTGAGTAARAQ